MKPDHNHAIPVAAFTTDSNTIGARIDVRRAANEVAVAGKDTAVNFFSLDGIQYTVRCPAWLLRDIIS
jgi:hypothetical protein